MDLYKNLFCVSIGRSIRYTFLSAAVFLLLSTVAATNALSFQMTVAWDASTSSAVTGYKVYYGKSTRNYTSVVDAGKQTGCKLTGLSDGTTYYVAATAYDAKGSESDYSAELIVHTIVASSSPHGTISPEGTIVLADGGFQTFTFTPDANYYISEVAVDGVSIGTMKSYTVLKVKKDHTLKATFSKTAPAGVSQTASASGSGSGSSTGTPGGVAPSPGTSTSTTGTPAAGVPSLVADAGPDQQARPGERITLVGSNSTGSPQGISSYLWTQIQGKRVRLSNPKSAAVNFTAPHTAAQGDALVFQLTVTDRSNRKASDTCIVNVIETNHPPHADAGPDREVTPWTIVTLDGSKSSDPDDGIASCLWTQVSGPKVTILNPSARQASFVAPETRTDARSLVFQLTVTDHGGLKARDTCLVNLSHTGVPVSRANAGPDRTVGEGQVVRLDGSLSKCLPYAQAAYRWRQTGGPPVILSDPRAMRTYFLAPLVECGNNSPLSFTLTLTDGSGLKSADSCTVRIKRAK